MWSTRSKVGWTIVIIFAWISTTTVILSARRQFLDSLLINQQRSWKQLSWSFWHPESYSKQANKLANKFAEPATSTWDGARFGRPSYNTGIHLRSLGEQIPIIYIALNRRIKMASTTIPFACESNDIVILLTNIRQSLAHTEAPCLRIHDVSRYILTSESELPWPRGAPLNQQIFFTRWYVLRNWMQATGTRQVMAIDSDVLLYRNVTALVRAHPAHFCQHSLWLAYEPPRASQGFLLITLDALTDVTRFWKHLLSPAVWTSEYIGGTSPNDMIAMGHYCHVAVGRPYPCWGYGRTHAPGTCDDTIAYGHAVVLARLAAAGVTAAHPPGPLSILADGSTPGGIGVVVDKNFKHDPIGIYDMSFGYKRVRYSSGVPQLRLTGGALVEALGLVMEDELEGCAPHHIAHARARASCACTSLCCDGCTPE